MQSSKGENILRWNLQKLWREGLQTMGSKYYCSLWFPFGSDGKKSACNVGDPGSSPGSGRSPWEGHGHSLQFPIPGKSHGHRILAGCHPWDPEESHITEWLTLALLLWGPEEGGSILRWLCDKKRCSVFRK